jgi:hypothetical protein
MSCDSLDHSGRDRGHDLGRRVRLCSGETRGASADRTLPACVLHSRGERVERGDRLFERYGAATVFLARFLFGMRVLASLLAGALHMPWRKFVLFNFLGAAVWVTAICGAGYLFGGHWGRLAMISGASIWWLAIVVVAGRLCCGGEAAGGAPSDALKTSCRAHLISQLLYMRISASGSLYCAGVSGVPACRRGPWPLIFDLTGGVRAGIRTRRNV